VVALVKEDLEDLEVLVVVGARDLFREARHSVATPVKEDLVLVAA